MGFVLEEDLSSRKYHIMEPLAWEMRHGHLVKEHITNIEGMSHLENNCFNHFEWTRYYEYYMN